MLQMRALAPFVTIGKKIPLSFSSTVPKWASQRLGLVTDASNIQSALDT